MATLKIVVLERCGQAPPLPRYETSGAAALDLRAFLPEGPVVLPPGDRCAVPTGLKMAVPPGFAGLVLARSGLASRQGLALANGVGVIDSDYRGEVMVGLINLGDRPCTVEHGQRIAQFMLVPAPEIELEPVEALDETDRGEGGFGSTGR